MYDIRAFCLQHSRPLPSFARRTTVFFHLVVVKCDNWTQCVVSLRIDTKL